MNKGWWDIKAYKTKEDYDNYGEYLYESGYSNKKDATKDGKGILKEGYALVFIHSHDDEQIIPLHKNVGEE